jgi:ABC-type transport system involved in cytochrome bd biosynthesis fused ATPase/permease subunit
VIEQFNLEVAPGERLAIVGLSGTPTTLYIRCIKTIGYNVSRTMPER